MDFDSVLQVVGSRGKYQQRVFLLVCLPIGLPATFLAFAHVFASASPPHWCRLDPSQTGQEGNNWTSTGVESWNRSISLSLMEVGGKLSYSKCYQYDESLPERPIIPCKNGWSFDDTLYDSTLVTEFELVCDRSWILSLSTTLFYVGSLIGNTLLGWASDRWGRRTVFYPILVGEIILSILTPLSPSMLVYIVLRTLRGLFYPAIFQIAFILGLELTGAKERSGISSIMCCATAVSAVLLGLVAMATRNWRTLGLVTSVPLVLLLGTFWVLPESPRWLLTKNRIEEAEEVVQKIAAANGKRLPRNYLKSIKRDWSPIFQNKRTTSPLDLVMIPSIRYKYLVILFNWISAAVAYNSMAYYMTHLGVNDYTAFILNSLVEIPSYLTMGWSMDKFGRRLSLILSMLLGGVSCLSSIFIGEDMLWARVLLALIGKLGCSSAYTVFYVYVAEVLPTELRAQAMGIGSFISGLALLGFPYVVDLADDMKSLPLIVLGFLSTASGLLACTLPETKETPLPQYAAELVDLVNEKTQEKIEKIPMKKP